MRRRHRGNSINITLLYKILIQFVPKWAAVLICTLFVLFPLIIFSIPLYRFYSNPLLKMANSGMKDVRNNIRTVEKQLNNAAKISSNISTDNTFNSEGLAKYYQKGIVNSVASGNKLNTDFAELEFSGNGQCFSNHSCKAKYKNSSGTYTIYLKDNGKGQLKTNGYSWTSY